MIINLNLFVPHLIYGERTGECDGDLDDGLIDLLVLRPREYQGLTLL